MTARQPVRELSPGEQERRRRRERVNQYRRRARLGGKTVTAETLARVSVRLAAPPPPWDLPAGPACAGADPGLFFGPEHETPEARGQRLRQARVFCAACPVSAECLEGARDRGERYGVWGGADLEAERALRAAQATRPGVPAPDRAGPGQPA
jgi:Transcription factor WhiB